MTEIKISVIHNLSSAILLHAALSRRRPRMTDDAYGATVAKRRLSRRLLQLRVRERVHRQPRLRHAQLGPGQGGPVRGQSVEAPRDERHPGPAPDLRRGRRREREELEELAIRARARPWWRDYSDIFENEFPGFENDASRIRVFMPLVLPGLLQTQDYAEAFMRIGPRPPAWRRKALDTRLRRQEILSRPGGTAPHADRRHHRGVPAVPVGLAIGAARPDRAPDRHGPPSQHRPAHPAVRRRPAAGPHRRRSTSSTSPRASRASPSPRPTSPSLR